ncbi:MAG: sensor histidine kinase [Lachnospiraceae bacterium]|nr:sensor histidine kinase [Lachnospiraceae bacterium]
MADTFYGSICTAAAFFAFIEPICHREKRRRLLPGILLLALTGFAGFSFPKTNIFAAGIVISVLFIIQAVIVHFITEERWQASFYVCICAGMVFGIIYELGEWLCNIPGPYLFSPGVIMSAKRLAVLIVLVPLIYRFFASTMPGEGHYDIGPRQISLALVEYILFEVMEMVIRVNSLNQTEAGEFVMMALFFSQLLLIVILYLQHIMFRNSAMQKEMQALNLLWNEQKAQYDLARENIDLINRKCHDLKHQIRALRGEEGRIKDPKYLDELADSIQIYESIVKTGNEALDTILTEKSLHCRENRIKISCVADGGQLSFMDLVDLYSIFGNAIDNAIEEVQRFALDEMRQIDVIVFRREDLICIEVINPLHTVPKFVDNLPQTTKGDNGYHGFGVKSIKHTIEKYGGHITVSTDSGCFSLKMIVPVPH